MNTVNYPVQIENPTCVALGFFDGVHLAHRAILKMAVSLKSQGLTPTVFTFNTLSQKSPTGLLTVKSEKEHLMEAMGIELLCYGEFDLMKNLSTEEFVRDVLKENLRAKAVICGYNYRFGKKAQGDTEILKTLCKNFGIRVFVQEEFDFLGEEVSSSRIKNLLLSGEVEKASALLSAPYSIKGKVVHGRKLGRKMGKPTLNIAFDSEKFLPKFGVYATRVSICDTVYNAVANLGVKPTVTGENIPTLEAYLLDAEGDFYGETAQVDFAEFIREEKRFEDIKSLQKAIETDTKRAEAILK